VWIGINIDGGRTLDELFERVRSARASGFATAWLPQSPGAGPLAEVSREHGSRRNGTRRPRHQLFGYDSLTALAVAGREVDGIELGTCVTPIFPRHPMVLAEQALTVQAVRTGPVTLGIGVSHRHVVEDQWGYRYDRTVLRMREYVTVLNELFETGAVSFSGQTTQARGTLSFPIPGRVPVLLAALGPQMLRVAGEHASGVITWMTGVRTLETHIVPTVNHAAGAAGRPAPRVVASLPVCVTDDADAARQLARRMFLIYRSLPSYRAMLDREKADDGGDIALVGSEEDVARAVKRLEEIGVTDLNALIIGSETEQMRAKALLPALGDQSRQWRQPPSVLTRSLGDHL
jgi:F420-dependent oxidoreductase-like protein